MPIIDPHIAIKLRSRLTSERITVPAAIAQQDDPLEVLRWTGSLGDDRLTSQMDDALRKAELAAVATAEPTPFAREVIVAAHEADRRLAIVSNNSAAAIQAYIAAHRLTAHHEIVVGRDEPKTMKATGGLLATTRGCTRNDTSSQLEVRGEPCASLRTLRAVR